MTLSHVMARLAGQCAARPWRVLAIWLALAVLSGAIAAWRLDVSTDADALFAKSLPWRQRAIAFDRDFPQFRDLLVAVIDAETPEAADATAEGLRAALAADGTHFHAVRRPDAGPFFDKNGLLFLEPAELQGLLDRTIDAQPFLGQLAADPSARGLFAALSLLAVGVDRGVDVSSFAAPLVAFHVALDAAAAGKPRPLSWQALLGGGLAEKAGRFRFVLAQAKLDLGALEPGAAATQALRAAAAGLPHVREGAAHVRVTGEVALQDEEFATVAQGAVAGTIASAALVLLWLGLAVRSWRQIVPIVLMLGLGLAVTTGFAAAAIGTLNLISVAFAVLFVGIAVDFAIQFCARGREVGQGDAAAAVAGPPILISAGAAAAGFLAFAPTSFDGVAELGLIAGVGMLVALAATFTALPAMLAITRARSGGAAIGLAFGDRAEAELRRRRAWVLGGFALAGLAGLAALPMIRFDSDPLHTKDSTTEAMRTLADLAASPLTTPYAADIVVPNADAAAALMPRLAALPLVGDVLSLSSFVPEAQPEKLAAIADAAGLLAATLAPRAPAAAVTAEDLRLAAAAARRQVEHVRSRLPPDHPLVMIGADLARLEAAPDDVLRAANDALVRFLPAQLTRLRAGLAAGPVTLADLPPEIARDWRLPDGRVRVQVTPKVGALDAGGLAAFVAEVRSVAPEAGGAAVQIVETAATITGAFRTAAMLAMLGIAVLLAVVLRRPLDVLLVLVALALSSLLTVLVSVLAGLSLNFANIIAQPLLQGVGVSFTIYFVMNWRAGQPRFLGSATARGILFSALTTATAFGSLALSHHPGTASMGRLLLIGLGATLLVTFIFLPVLLRTLMREDPT